MAEYVSGNESGDRQTPWIMIHLSRFPPDSGKFPRKFGPRLYSVTSRQLLASEPDSDSNSDSETAEALPPGSHNAPPQGELFFTTKLQGDDPESRAGVFAPAGAH
eukprot:134779-Hanusia_phi.AAC.1